MFDPEAESDADDEVYTDAQERIETILENFPMRFAVARAQGPAACAEELEKLANECLFIAAALFHATNHPLFGLAWSAAFAGDARQFDDILPMEDSDHLKTKQLLADLCNNRLRAIEHMLTDYELQATAEEVFAAWQDGSAPIGLLVSLQFGRNASETTQAEVGAPVTARIRELADSLPILRESDFTTRAYAYADAGLACRLAAAGYWVWADDIGAFIKSLAGLDIVEAVQGIAPPMLPLLAEHYSAFAATSTLSASYPWAFSSQEAPQAPENP